MLDISLLGPTEARVSGVQVSLSPLERNLLAVLALSKGTVISTDRIIDCLWGERLPAAPRSRVQGLISSLRRKLGDALITRHPGYLISATETAIDLEQCELLAQQARQASSPNKVARYLHQALGLWRGEPLDGVSAPGIEFDRVRLAELRLGLIEERYAADLELGRHREVVGEIAATLAAHPLREKLAGQLMLALYRCNRQADALKIYQTLRERLVDELGSDPCAELRSLHSSILRGDPLDLPVTVAPDAAPAEPSAPQAARPPGDPGLRRPAQLPASVGHFTGREADLAALTRAIGRPCDEPCVLLVSGVGGIGKTALVVRWAHTVAARFPDGQIFVDLHGHAESEALTSNDALAGALSALGMARAEIPGSADEKAALYRTLISGRRMLIVADDAGGLDQVLALVPPTATSQLVVTSRSRLVALAAHHAVEAVRLEPLSAQATHDLLARIAGAQRMREPGAEVVVRWCGGWPLVARLVGARLAAHPWQPLVSFVDELNEVADQLLDDDARSVRAALDRAHRSLSPAAAYLLRRLCAGTAGTAGTADSASGDCGAGPGGAAAVVSLDPPTAATGPVTRRVRRLLDELVSAHLVVEVGPGRYRIHEVVRRFAHRRDADLVDRDAVDEWISLSRPGPRMVDAHRI